MDENEKYLTEQLITYLGNKRKLLDFIGSSVQDISKKLNKKKLDILDGFSGSGVVSRYLKQYSNMLYVNDIEYYTSVINSCYLSNKSEIDIQKVKQIINDLNSSKLKNDFVPGIIEKFYAPKNDKNIKQGERVFYTNKNAKIIDNLRRIISDIEYKQYFFLAPLLSEASIHANTSGVFKGFYKNSKTGIGQFGGNAENCLARITGEINLPYPIFSNFECDCHIFIGDINKLIKNNICFDIAYYDPPYNQHPYGSNYFMLNVIAKYEEPQEVSKVSGIPSDWNKSLYNKRKKALDAFEDLICNTNAKFILLSYNDEGFVSYKEFKKIAKKYGKINLRKRKYSAFKGSRNLNNRSKTVDEFLITIEKK